MTTNMKRDVLVSIITPCYNSEKTIRQTLDCMIHQTYQNYEYIIIDGASKDSTMDIIRQYSPLFGKKLTIVSEPDNGIYEAMNKGIRMAMGQLIGIINSDDYYENDAIENMVAAMTDEKYQILYGFLRCFEGEQEIKVELYHHSNLSNKMITHPTCFVTKPVYEDYGMYDASYRSSADYEFMLRIYDRGGVSFIPVYKIISNLRYGGMSHSEIGYRETMMLHLHRGTLKKGRYIRLLIKSYIHDIKDKLSRVGQILWERN